MRKKDIRCKDPGFSEHGIWNFFVFAGVESLETGGHLVSDEAGRVKGHPWKRNEESGEPHNSESSCLSSFVPNGLCGQKRGCFGLMIQDFNNTWNVNFQMFKLILEKAEEPEIKLPASAGSSKKQESSRKTSISVLLTMPKPLTVWITTHCGKFWKRWEYQTTWPASWETYM